MNVSVIVPSNSKNRINEFIKSYSKLKDFKNSVNLIIVGNGKLKQNDIKDNDYMENKIDYIQCNWKGKIVPFAKLRGDGIIHANNKVKQDWYLFLDDDHRFGNESDLELMKCLDFLSTHSECGILQLEKHNHYKSGFYIKKNAHIWTSRGLFIRNVNLDHKKYFGLVGACEDLLYGYETLNESYIPYCIWNSGISRNGEEKGYGKENIRYKELNNPSYSEKLLDKNIIGYIRKKYLDEDWKFYGRLVNLQYPKHLRELIKSRLRNEII